ncbi:aldehyde dehydrogenase family protein [Conexibacter sp. CPCC 206217]|uniref:aldehyde dehydrogenase family protein n=1 Tax=Conexibacter sp. CPCC 206217 TaxID=3064574 RepID=UPI002726B389|nr:aldehyde dehydrogenase family protein [Conexibacter sp. CPCC 206217]MDO8211233.1 aldehyde dehydrogenase family protein [Conexibacter sp. CPCC 206217]
MTTTTATTIEIRNPADGELIGTLEVADAAQIATTIANAQEGRRAMAALPAHARADLLQRIADGIAAREQELANLLARENGKPIAQTRGEVAAAIRIFRGFAEESKRIFGRQIPLDAVPGLERNLAFTRREPLGVIAAIVPFNYPVELYAHKAAAALAAGNAVIVKPPEKCPLAVIEIAEIVEQAGAPQHAHQLLGGGPEVASALASDPGINLISLTGSTVAGRAISALAAPTLKRVHLELGSNDPMIVCADADLDKAAEAIVLGRLARGNGQICCAVKRIFVEDAVHDELAAKLLEQARGLKIGDPLEEDTEVGPLITEAAAKAVEASIQQAVADGATLALGGGRDGAFVQPTVLTGVKPNEPAIEMEIFGPVAPLVRVDSAEQAVDFANDSEYGLHAAVFTRDISRAFKLAARLEAGGVIVNGSTALRSENLPFGGVKQTGGAREGLHDTLRDMTEEKTIIVMDALG